MKKEVVLFLKDAHFTILDVERALIKDNSDIALNTTCNKKYAEYRKEKAKNGRNCVAYVWTIDGVTKSAAQWCREYGVSSSPILNRIRRYGMSPLEALLAPAVPKTRTADAEAWYREIGYKYGVDKTSYITPRDKWPSEFEERAINRCQWTR